LKLIARLVKHGRSALVACIALTGCTSQDSPPPSPPSEYSVAVGPQGAVIQGPDQVTLAVPTGAITDTTVVSIARSSSDAPDLVGIALLSPIYAIAPQGVRFNSNALLSVPYDVNKLPAGAQAFVLRGEPDGTWHVQAIEGTQPGVAQVNVSNLSWYAVGACTPTGGGSFGFSSMDCPGSYQLRLEMLDANGQPVPVPRDAQGRALPFTPEITAPTNVVLRLTWTRPAGINRNDDVQLAGGGAGFGIGSLLAWTSNQQTFTQNVTLQIDPATVPNAANPIGVVRRFQATATYCFTGSTTSGGPVRRVPWSFDIDVAFRIRDIGIRASAPVIVAEPGSGTLEINRSNGAVRSQLTFNVVATGTPPLSYQWRFNGQPLSDRPAGIGTSSISGATTDTLTVDNVDYSDAAIYTVEVSNGIGSNAVSTGVGVLVYPAQVIETDTGTALDPQVAFDPSGTALAIWRQFDGTRYNIWTNRYTFSTEWETPRGISANPSVTAVGDAQAPQIAVAANGYALAVWSQLDSAAGRSHIWANQQFAGAWRSEPLRIDTNTPGDAAAPQMALDANGDAMVVWQQSAGGRSSIWACRYTTNNQCSAPELIETLDEGDAMAPQIAVDTRGNALAVWQQSDGTRTNIWSNEYSPINGWGTAQLVETSDGDAQAPQIVLDELGTATAVWQQSDGTRFNIWANRYSLGDAWGIAESIEDDNVGDAILPQIALGGSGVVWAVWQQVYGTVNNAGGTPIPLHHIWSNRFSSASQAWQEAEVLSNATNTLENAFDAQIAVNELGFASAVWSEYSNALQSSVDIRGRYRLGSFGWGNTLFLSQSVARNSGSAFAPQTAIDSRGNALVVWQRDNALSGSDIWSNDGN